MSLTDVCGPAGLGFVFVGMAIGGVDVLVGMAVAAFGFLLLALSR